MNATNLSNLFVEVVFLDICISKGFDSVNHYLLSRLNKLGLDATTSNLFSSFLCNGHHWIAIHACGPLQWPYLHIGCSQGSVLGLLLFPLFINDLPAYLTDVITVLFADDTTMIVAGHSVSDISDTLLYALASICTSMAAGKWSAAECKQNQVYAHPLQLSKTPSITWSPARQNQYWAGLVMQISWCEVKPYPHLVWSCQSDLY